MNRVIGNPVPIRIGRKVYLVGYVSMAEWQTFGELQKKMLTRYSLSYLLYASLHRADPQITKRSIRHLFRWHKKHITTLIETICDISIPEIKKKEQKVSDKDNERNTKTIYRLLSRMHGWPPSWIDDMSPMQVHVYLTGGSTGTGTQKMTDEQYQSFLLARRMRN